MLRKMTLNRVKNYIKDKAIFQGFKLVKRETLSNLFYLVCERFGKQELVFSLTSGFINSWGYLSWTNLPDITSLDNLLRDYEKKIFN